MGCLEIMLQNICLSKASTATWPRPHPGDFCISTKRKIPSFPEQYVPVLHNSPSKVFSDVQTELPVFQFLLIASCPAPRHHLAASSLHILFRYTLVNLPWGFLKLYRSGSLTSPHRRGTSVPSPYLWSFTELSLCLYSAGVHITLDVASPVLNREEQFFHDLLAMLYLAKCRILLFFFSFFVARIYSGLISNWCAPGPPHPSACKAVF